MGKPARRDTIPQACARRAGLRYVRCGAPGLRRVGAGNGFRYEDPNGRRVVHEATLARIRALAIPPAWSDVWIARGARDHLQATGRDAAGRKQYRYHARWSGLRSDEKFERLVDFGAALGAIRARVASDLARRAVDRQRVLAAAVRLLDCSWIRVGNDEYARSHDARGLTTLESRHVRLDGRRIRVFFRGKAGKRHFVHVHDRRLADTLVGIRRIPGRALFRFRDAAGRPRRIRASDVNAYLREISGREFTAKDFRTWGGTLVAALALQAEPLPPTLAARRRAIRRVSERVALQLGNTSAISRRYYVSPFVWDAFLEGELHAGARRLASGDGEGRLEEPRTLPRDDGLGDAERALLRFLRRAPASRTTRAA